MSNLISRDEFSSLIQEYASYKRSIQGCSQKTVDEYLLDLRTFFRYLIARERDISFYSEEFFKIDVREIGLEVLGKIRAEDLYDYLSYVTDDRENKWSARARKLSAIRSLYKYLVNKRNYIENNPAQNIESPKQKKSLPKSAASPKRTCPPTPRKAITAESLSASSRILTTLSKPQTQATRLYAPCALKKEKSSSKRSAK